MKILLLVGLIINTTYCISQNNMMKKKLDVWSKAVVNIETESLVYNLHQKDSVLKSKSDSGYTASKLDSLKHTLEGSTIVKTGTAIYMIYKERKYLVSAKHVFMDDVLVEQKQYENRNGVNIWDKVEAIPPRFSIRTPFRYTKITNQVNNFAVLYNNFLKNEPPYFFISDSTGDGIGVISLQEKNFKSLDTLLQMNGYKPMSLDSAMNNKSIEVLDEVYAIGYPEGVSIISQFRFFNKVPLNQSTDIVEPFVVRGTIAMYEPDIQHYFVDMTITPGNSGSAIIKDGKLIGIVSGINKYKIINENRSENFNLSGIGHLVNIINVSQLKERIELYQKVEEKINL